MIFFEDGPSLILWINYYVVAVLSACNKGLAFIRLLSIIKLRFMCCIGEAFLNVAEKLQEKSYRLVYMRQ